MNQWFNIAADCNEVKHIIFIIPSIREFNIQSTDDHWTVVESHVTIAMSLALNCKDGRSVRWWSISHMQIGMWSQKLCVSIGILCCRWSQSYEKWRFVVIDGHVVGWCIRFRDCLLPIANDYFLCKNTAPLVIGKMANLRAADAFQITYIRGRGYFALLPIDRQNYGC